MNIGQKKTHYKY